jgi:hypothetical protein
MRVNELIDILRDYPPELEVELAIVAASEPNSPDLSVDHYSVDGVMQWPGEDAEDDVVWLIGGEPDDVEDLLDALEAEVDDVSGAGDTGDTGD